MVSSHIGSSKQQRRLPHRQQQLFRENLAISYGCRASPLLASQLPSATPSCTLVLHASKMTTHLKLSSNGIHGCDSSEWQRKQLPSTCAQGKITVLMAPIYYSCQCNQLSQPAMPMLQPLPTTMLQSSCKICSHNLCAPCPTMRYFSRQPPLQRPPTDYPCPTPDCSTQSLNSDCQ